jgi:tubby-related protein 1
MTISELGSQRRKKTRLLKNTRLANKEMMLVFSNKEPKWNETVQAYVLNFNGRVDQASVKNFQLIMGDENYIFMQFGKVGKNDFNMDVQWPLSIFQAFTISLSSIDKKFG